MSSDQSRTQITSPPPPYSEVDPAKATERHRSHSRGRKADYEIEAQPLGVQVAVAQMHVRCMKPIQQQRRQSKGN